MTRPNEQISWKTKRLLWRARLSMPVLLSRYDEGKVVSIAAGINGGLAVITISLFAWLSNLPLLFPAIGPSLFILFSSPMSPPAAPRNVILSHLTCMLCGLGAWHLISALSVQPVTIEYQALPVYISAALALFLCCLLMVSLNIGHPPACASGLVVALGMVTQWQNLLLMMIVITWLTLQATTINRLMGVAVPLWSPHKNKLLQ